MSIGSAFIRATRMPLGLAIVKKLIPLEWYDERRGKNVMGIDPVNIVSIPEVKHLLRRAGISNNPHVENADLVPFLINAIKELSDRVDALEKTKSGG